MPLWNRVIVVKTKWHWTQKFRKKFIMCKSWNNQNYRQSSLLLLLLLLPFYGSLDFVLDNPGEPVPEETYTHSHLSWSSIIPYLLPPSFTIHGILCIQFTWLTVFFHNLSPSFLWPTSWPGLSTSYSVHFYYLHPIIVFFLQHMPIPSQFCLAVVSKLCHLFLVSLSTPYLELYLVVNATHPSEHSHLCLLKCHLIFHSHGQVSLPCNILQCTQLLYNLPLTINNISLLVSND